MRLVDALLGRRSCGRDKHTPSSLVEGVLSLTSHWVTRLGPSAAPWEQGRQATRTNAHWGQELGSTVAGNSSLSHNASGCCTWQPLCEPTAPANPTRHWAPLPKTSCLRGSAAATQMCEQGGKAGGRGQLPLGNRAPSCRCHQVTCTWASVSPAVKGSSWAGPAVCF